MKQDPRPTIHMEKLLLIAVKLGGMEPQVISRARQTVFARLMESQILHQLAGSVEGRFRKGTMVSAHLDARYFGFSLYTTGDFQAATTGAGAQRG